METVKQDSKLENISIFYRTDSMNLLYWNKNEENFDVFVINRVKKIRAHLSFGKRNPVPGYLNPTDIPSRGCSVETVKVKKWHEGPMWLKYEPDFCPVYDIAPKKYEVNKKMRKQMSLLWLL